MSARARARGRLHSVADLRAVEAQLEAYNARDVDRFLACYSPARSWCRMARATARIDASGVRARALLRRIPRRTHRASPPHETRDYVIDEECIYGWARSGTQSRMDAARLEVYEGAFRVMDAAVAAAADGDLLQAKTLRNLPDVEVWKVLPYPLSEPCVSLGRLADWG
jgi:hypothetical protein